MGYRVLNFFNFVLHFTVCYLISFGNFLQSSVTNKDESSLGELMQLLYTRIERMMPFVSFYFLLFFASMFN